MRWTQKARIQRLCAMAPRGDVAYRLLQRRLGTLTSDPHKRLPQHVDMARGLVERGVDLKGARLLEVGTGHVPVAPVAFFLVGAAEVVSVDLHRRLDLDLTSQMLRRLGGTEARLQKAFHGIVDPKALSDRLAVVTAHADRPLELFERIGIRYVAPGDARRLAAAEGSYDVHFSITVLEHIDPPSLSELLREARRVLAPGGVAAHFIDASDHFAHQDPTITRINFLRFSQARWKRLAGNEFAYTNRLRAPQLEQAFHHAGLRVEHSTRTVDARSLAGLREGFPLDRDFAEFSEQDLCTTSLRLYARPA